MKNILLLINNFLPERIRGKRGSWWAVGTTVVSAGAGALSARSSAKNSREAQQAEQDRLDALEFEESEDFTEIQASQKKLGQGILQGDVPDYFKAIGETGGQEFEDMLALTNRDINTSVAEAQAKGGIVRGGQFAAATAKATADSSITARYNDYQRSLQGKEYLFGQGQDIVNRVSSNAYNDAINRTNFNINKNNALNTLDYKKADTKSQEMASYMGILSSLSSTVGNIGSSGGFGKIKNKTKSQSDILGFDTRQYR